MKQNKFAIILLIISVIILINSTSQEKTEKKTGGIGTTVAITGTVGSLAWMGLLNNPVTWVILGIVGILFLGPSLISSWSNVFNPQPSIPMFVWIIAFVVVLVFVLKKK